MKKTTPLLMKSPLVLASLEGRKTQTRRLRGLEKINGWPDEWWRANVGRIHCPASLHHGKFGAVFRKGKFSHFMPCPYGGPGDLIWVRETWRPIIGQSGRVVEVDYLATPTERMGDLIGCGVKWKPSIHMPRSESRLTLRITDVRVERLQDISEADSIAEGIQVDECGHAIREHDDINWGGARGAFVELWESINAARGYGWEANPWVWAITYEAIAANVDQVLEESADPGPEIENCPNCFTVRLAGVRACPYCGHEETA